MKRLSAAQKAVRIVQPQMDKSERHAALLRATSRVSFTSDYGPSLSAMDRVDFIGEVQFDSLDDSGAALILEVHDEMDPDAGEGVFVRLQSWRETSGSMRDHPTAGLVGKRVRVTIEPVQDRDE